MVSKAASFIASWISSAEKYSAVPIWETAGRGPGGAGRAVLVRGTNRFSASSGSLWRKKGKRELFPLIVASMAAFRSLSFKADQISRRIFPTFRWSDFEANECSENIR